MAPGDVAGDCNHDDAELMHMAATAVMPVQSNRSPHQEMPSSGSLSNMRERQWLETKRRSPRPSST